MLTLGLVGLIDGGCQEEDESHRANDEDELKAAVKASWASFRADQEAEHLHAAPHQCRSSCNRSPDEGRMHRTNLGVLLSVSRNHQNLRA